MTDAESGQSKDNFFDMIKDIPVAMLTTMAADGTLRSRPMIARHDDFDGVLWFFTHDEANVANDIGAHPQVNLAYADPEEGYFVSVICKSEIIHDADRVHALWTDSLRPWFPSGPDDKDLALLKITVEQARYWNAQGAASSQKLQ